jgi:hypothetical protein
MLRHRLLQANPNDGGGAGAGAGAAAGAPAAGASNADWFPAEHKDYVANKGWKNPADVLTSAINLEKLIGADKAGRTVVLPKDDKDAEGIKAFRAKLGVPEKPEEYELPLAEGDKGEFAKTVAGWFHAQGVPKSAAQAIAKQWNEHIGGIVKAEQDAAKIESEKQLGTLKGEWGGDFEKNSEFARRFLRASGWDDAKVALYEQTFGTAAMLKDFHAFGSKFQESPLAGGQGGGGSFTISKQAAQTKLEEIRKARMAGTITDQEWKASKEAEFAKLSEIVAGA